jgi:hypothetical protein
MHLTQEIVLEFSRLGLVFVHLLACCVAIGLVLRSDVALVKAMLKGDRSTALAQNAEMKQLQSIVALALAILWATGAWIIAMDTISKDGLHYFANPKIQAKILMVSLLTLNGVMLHNLVLPWMEKAGSLLQLSFDRTALACFAGTVSGVSWMYAAMLGVGRPLSWKYSLLQILAAYPVLIAGGFAVMMGIVAWCKAARNMREDHEFAF